MSSQKDLFIFNRIKLSDPMKINKNIIKYESQWINGVIDDIKIVNVPVDFNEFVDLFNNLIDKDINIPSSSAEYISDSMSIDEFKCIVKEFAIDGLTEAQVCYYILPRLPLRAQMPMLRIMIDEFGSGNYLRTHTNLYIKLLSELNMPVDYEYYISELSDSSFEFLNMFYWLTLRSDNVSFFAGALTYLETIIPSAFNCFSNCCFRLGIKSHFYYTEHQHIDSFHSMESISLLRELHISKQLDFKKTLVGVMLAREIMAKAFENSVTTAVSNTKLFKSQYEDLAFD